MYQEPARDDVLSKRVPQKVGTSIYDEFMDEQNIPIHRGIGAYDVRQLPVAPWTRMGGQGTFIELDGQAGYFGMYVIEVPAGGVLNSERHVYEEQFLVIEGHGSTEVWREGSSKKLTFEWQAGTFFGVPLNVWHRLVNATSSPALVLAATSAPNIMEFFPSRSFIFDNSFEFLDRYDESKDYFKPRDPRDKTFDLDRDGERPVLRDNLIPDIANCHLPRSNRGSPGDRMLHPHNMAGDTFFKNHIHQWLSGRYNRAHSHEAGRVLVCLKGKGYSLTWPLALGKRPWEAGKGHLVKRQDYIPGGMCTAAPAAGDWFHQHMSTAKVPLRLIAIRHPLKLFELNGEERELPDGTMYLGPGRHEILFREEDPQVRKDYQEALEKEGAEFTMPEEVYR